MSRAPRPADFTPSSLSLRQTGAASRGRQHDLEAVFAGVAGARDEPRADLASEEDVKRERRRRRRRRQQLRDFRARIRTLHRDHREVGALGELDAERLRLRAHPGQVLVARAGVHDDAEPGLGQKIDDEVVDDAAGLVEHAAVERLARSGQLRHVVREQAAQELAHLGAASVDHAHVRHVEDARIAAHGVVLLDLRAVVDGHVPPAEIHHARALLDVQVIEEVCVCPRTSPRCAA